MTETLSNFLAGVYGDLNIVIYSDDSHQEPDKLYNGSITQLPEDLLTRFGESAIDVFDENMNPTGRLCEYQYCDYTAEHYINLPK